MIMTNTDNHKADLNTEVDLPAPAGPASHHAAGAMSVDDLGLEASQTFATPEEAAAHAVAVLTQSKV